MASAKHIVDKGNEVVWFKEPLYVKTTISSDHLKELKEVANKILDTSDTSQSKNYTLAGNIEKEFYLGESQKILEPYACSLANYYLELIKKPDVFKPESDEQFLDNTESFYTFDKAWINFQKKFEFNPIHYHTRDFSYVLWIQIPYDLEEELSFSNCVNSNTPSNSLFNFYITNTAGNIVNRELMINKSWEGTMVLFPAKTKHQVYPFYTSDDYRISIAGNLKHNRRYKVFAPFNYG